MFAVQAVPKVHLIKSCTALGETPNVDNYNLFSKMMPNKMMVYLLTTRLFQNKNKVMNDEGGQEDPLKCCQPTSSKMQMRQLSSTFYVYFGGF